MSETKEGWQSYKANSQRVYHYIVNGWSLCRKLGFYFNEVDDWTGNPKQSEDCAACYKLAAKRNHVQVQPAPVTTTAETTGSEEAPTYNK